MFHFTLTLLVAILIFVPIIAFVLTTRVIPPKIYLTSGQDYVWHSEKLIYFKALTEKHTLTLTCNSSVPVDWEFNSTQNEISKVNLFTRKRIVNHFSSNDSDDVFEISVTIKSIGGLIEGMYICKSLLDRALEDTVFLFPTYRYQFSVEAPQEIRPRLDDTLIVFPCTFPYFKPTVPPTLYRKQWNMERSLISNESYVTYEPTKGFYLWANESLKSFEHKQSPSSWTNYECVHNYKENVNVYIHIRLYEPAESIFTPQSDEFHGQQMVSCASKYPIIINDEEGDPLEDAFYFRNQSSPYLYNARAVINDWAACSKSAAPRKVKTWTPVPPLAEIKIDANIGLHGEGQLSCVQTVQKSQRQVLVQLSELNTYRCNEPAECNFLQNQLSRVTQNERRGTLCATSSQYTISPRPVAAQCSTRGMAASSSIYIFALDLDRNFFQLNSSLNDFGARRLVEMKSSSKVAYLGEPVRFSCVAVRFLFSNVHWVFHYINGSSIFHTTEGMDVNNTKTGDEFELRGIIQHRSTTIQINDARISAVSCCAPFWNSWEWANATQSIDVRARVPPQIVRAESIENIAIQPIGEEIRLTCDVSGHPEPTINWTGNFIEGRDARIDTAISVDGNIPSVLVLRGEISQTEDEFICTATNMFGPTKKTFRTVASKTLHPGIITAIVASILLVGTAISILMWTQHRKVIRMRNLLTEKDIKDFLEGSPDSKGVDTDPLSSGFPETFKIKRDSFVCGVLLGYGAYGIVYSGIHRPKTVDEDSSTLNPAEQKVAVKTVQQGADVQFVRSLLSEIKSMVYVGSHEHIVKFIGACIQNIRYNEIFVILEFCAGGCLESFLRDHRADIQDLLATKIDEESVESDSGQETPKLTTRNLLLWSRQISSAMHHLTKKKLIHGDLAARNVLLMEDLSAKISDFGLAKQLYNYTEYKRVGQNLLPWAWMAVESLRDKQFSIQSDVWSFGVTLWEIFSLGQVPYGGLGFTMEFINMLELGLRLPKPAHASDLLYEIMTECWNIASNERPSFETLENVLSLIGKSVAGKESTVQPDNVTNTEQTLSTTIPVTEDTDILNEQNIYVNPEPDPEAEYTVLSF